MYKKKVYFIQPSITYHSRTERFCLELIKSELGEDIEIINPANLSVKRIKNWKEEIREIDTVVGMALEEKYVISVWTVLEYAESLKKPIYTIRIGEATSNWDKGILKDVEKLSFEETKRFTRSISFEDGKHMFRSMIFGKRSKY
jgi:hypothetical protein